MIWPKRQSEHRDCEGNGPKESGFPSATMSRNRLEHGLRVRRNRVADTTHERFSMRFPSILMAMTDNIKTVDSASEPKPPLATMFSIGQSPPPVSKASLPQKVARYGNEENLRWKTSPKDAKASAVHGGQTTLWDREQRN
jgi:hypothetical protein